MIYVGHITAIAEHAWHKDFHRIEVTSAFAPSGALVVHTFVMPAGDYDFCVGQEVEIELREVPHG